MKRLLMICGFAAMLAYSLGIDATTRAKSIKTQFVELDGIDGKTKWVISIDTPECGSGLPDSQFELKFWKAEDQVKIQCVKK